MRALLFLSLAGCATQAESLPFTPPDFATTASPDLDPAPVADMTDPADLAQIDPVDMAVSPSVDMATLPVADMAQPCGDNMQACCGEGSTDLGNSGCLAHASSSSSILLACYEALVTPTCYQCGQLNNLCCNGKNGIGGVCVQGTCTPTDSTNVEARCK